MQEEAVLSSRWWPEPARSDVSPSLCPAPARLPRRLGSCPAGLVAVPWTCWAGSHAGPPAWLVLPSGNPRVRTRRPAASAHPWPLLPPLPARHLLSRDSLCYPHWIDLYRSQRWLACGPARLLPGNRRRPGPLRSPGRPRPSTAPGSSQSTVCLKEVPSLRKDVGVGVCPRPLKTSYQGRRPVAGPLSSLETAAGAAAAPDPG